MRVKKKWGEMRLTVKEAVISILNYLLIYFYKKKICFINAIEKTYMDLKRYFKKWLFGGSPLLIV